MDTVSAHNCPHCGAPLPPMVNGKATCDFCGSTVNANSGFQYAAMPRQFGYEFEKGRYDAQNSIPGAELAAEIKKLLTPIDDLNQTRTSLSELQTKVKISEENLRVYTDKNKSLPYIIPVGAFLFLLWCEATFLPSLVVSLASWGFLKLRIGRNTKRLQSTYLSCNDRKTQTERHLDELKRTYNFAIIPEEYQYYEALSFFVKALNSGRAASLQQAINLYEDEKHKQKVLRLQAEQNRLKEAELEVQRQQLELAQQKKGVDWGAVAATAGAVAVAALTLKGKRK